MAGAKDRSTNRVSAAVVPGTDGPTLRGFVTARAADGASSSSAQSRTSPPFAVSLAVVDIDGTMIDFAAAMRARRDEVARDPAWRGRPLADVRRESFRRALAAAGVTDPAAHREAHDLYYRVRDASMAVFPDVAAGLDALRGRGLRLVAASNGAFPLARVGLDGYFEDACYAADMGVAKPDPAFFAEAVARAGGSPETTLALGDRLDNDYGPARAAGLHAVLVDRYGRAVGAPEVVRVRTLAEVAPLIAPPLPAREAPPRR